MKIISLATSLLLTTFATASVEAQSNSSGKQTSLATRARVLKTESKPPTPANGQSLQAHAKFNNNDAMRTRQATPDSPAGTSKAAPVTKAVATPSIISLASTQIYRVGPLDVLDVRLANSVTRQSTLFTVLENGTLEYPLAGAPVRVAGMTTAEIASLLQDSIKVFEHPQVVVNVRDFASHVVTVSGLVASPGKKALRREAVPLYTILAEALVLPEAARATVTRVGRPPMLIDVKDANHAATLITAGDVIKVYGLPPAPTEFFYTGGAINSPGQKPYHAGLTLTQAILASGGAAANAGDRIKVSRLGNNGRLISQEYNLKRIQLGRAVDPVLQKGDRIEVFPAE
ncbi:MAG TPA: polysaccharide biosynthesis/export family protein [Pyrinomonadaceae bacterium]|nr:polysaccharide biosynthesis/export family protein [Pyrinomonadaceae bacterium]